MLYGVRCRTRKTFPKDCRYSANVRRSELPGKFATFRHSNRWEALKCSNQPGPGHRSMTRLRLAQGTKRKAESLEAEAEQQEAPGMLRQFRASSVCGLPFLAVAPEASFFSSTFLSRLLARPRFRALRRKSPRRAAKAAPEL